MEIKKIKKCELESFYESDFYKNQIHIPFPLTRLQSYLNNPYSLENESVLYYIEINDQIVCYRIILHDQLFNGETVVWSSGNWTNPDFRKRGLSQKLYKEIQIDYSNQVIVYTRSVESINFYKKKTDLFFKRDNQSKELHYSFSFLEKQELFKSFKKLIELIGRKKSKNRFNLFDLSLLDEKTNLFLQHQSKKELFPLTIEKIRWIKNYPWLTTLKDNQKQFFDFSLVDSSFKTNAFEMRVNNETNAFYFRNIRQNIFYLHYAYYKTELDAKYIAQSVLAEFEIESIESIILRDELIIKYLRELHRPFIKKSYKNFLFIDDSKKEFLSKKNQHGIGELIFT